MSDNDLDIIRQQSRPLAPNATGVAPRLSRLAGIRCVLFDVYGTLLISGSGEVGTLLPDAAQGAFAAALASVGLRTELSDEQGRATLAAAVADSHRRSRAAGIDFPEVDIVEIWQMAVQDLLASDGVVEDRTGAADSDIDYARLALEYELRTNPVWPMPTAEECVLGLQTQGIATGLISNAQYFTPRLLQALLPTAFENLDSGQDVQYYSYRHGCAKPGETLYRLAAEELAGRGITPREVLYVGNDMLNDIWPAAKVGFRTALFAGDQRSLRWREEDPRVAEVTPDLVVTELASLLNCVAGND